MATVLQTLYLGPVGAGLILTAISAVYFVSGLHQPTATRVLKSSHGVLFACTMYPLVARHVPVLSLGGWLAYPFWIFLLLGIAATAYSLFGYAKRWSLHFLHVFTLLYGSLATLYGMHAL